MYSLLLKKALPFALTFILGSLIGGLFNFFFGTGGYTPAPARTYFYGYGEGHSCRMRVRQRYLVAESKPLIITFKPDARRPSTPDTYYDGHDLSPRSALVRVTFGADGKVQAVEPSYEYRWGASRLPLRPEWKDYWESVERAARLIQFTPEMENGVPVTVTKELEMFFLPE